MFLNNIIYPHFAYAMNNIRAFDHTNYFFTHSGVKAVTIFISQAFYSKSLGLLMDFCYIILGFIQARRMQRLKNELIGSYSINVTMFGILMIFGGLSAWVWTAGLFTNYSLMMNSILLLFAHVLG